MPGRSSDQVPNPAGDSLSAMPQQNGGSIPTQMQNYGFNHFHTDQSVTNIRKAIQAKIYEFLMSCPRSEELPQKKLVDVVRRLEEGLFKTAATKEEYMNMETLEARLHGLIKRLPLSSHDRQSQHVNKTSSIGTTIPTTQSGNSSSLVPPAMDYSMISRTGVCNTMNLQALMSEQCSGQVPNPAGNSLSAMPHQNGGSIPMQMQNSIVNRFQMDQNDSCIRNAIQGKIYEYLMHRQQSGELPQKKMMDIVRRLEEGLFKTATTKEEYMNLETLETRLHNLIKLLPMPNHNQRYQHVYPSLSTGTPLPTTGLAQSEDSSLLLPSSMHNLTIAGSGGHNMSQGSTNISIGLSGTSQIPAINQMEYSGGDHPNMGQNFRRLRKFIEGKICEFLLRQPQYLVMPQKKQSDVVRRLEEDLYETATTKEEYMNLETLEARLLDLIKSLPIPNHNKQTISGNTPASSPDSTSGD